jgi:hypothetical protein
MFTDPFDGPVRPDRPEPQPITITLPAAKLAEDFYSSDPADDGTWPHDPCGLCSSPEQFEWFNDGDHVRRVDGYGWVHERCAVARITSAQVDEAWLLLADAVTSRPSAFKASDIRAVMQNVARIARRGGGAES